MTEYVKLVRDRIPEILDAKGVSYEKHRAGEVEYRSALMAKLQEEVTEFTESGGAIEELADVLEVLLALQKLDEYKDVEGERVKKRDERGGFDERIILKGEK